MTRRPCEPRTRLFAHLKLRCSDDRSRKLASCYRSRYRKSSESVWRWTASRGQSSHLRFKIKTPTSPTPKPSRDRHMPGLRWSELEDPIKVSSILGTVSGGGGIIALGSLVIREAYNVQIVLAPLLSLLLIPLLTGLSLLFLQLTNEQRGVLGFVCFVSSVFIMVADYFLLFFSYCLAVHSTCS
jgi:hypothetical protein